MTSAEKQVARMLLEACQALLPDSSAATSKKVKAALEAVERQLNGKKAANDD